MSNLSLTPAGSASVAHGVGLAGHDQPSSPLAHRETDVSRETGAQDFAPTAAIDNRRKRRRAPVERNGKTVRIGPSWSAEEIDSVRKLVAAGCQTQDIAAHFNTTHSALSAMMHRQRILRRHPTVAEVLGADAPCADPRTLPLPASPQVNDPTLHPEPGEGRGVSIPVVTLTDRFEKYVGMVELHEVDPRGMARIRHIAGTHGHAGKWLTVPVLQLRFERAQDRTALIAQAKQRHAATIERRAALHQQSATGE